MNIYVASSWRNPRQPAIVAELRALEHVVYDFRHPPGGDHLGFSWADVDPEWTSWTPEAYRAALEHPVAVAGFTSDFEAMENADACVLVLPSGRSAHLEAGWFVGAARPLFVLLDRAEFADGAGHSVVELMYRMATLVTADTHELLAGVTSWSDAEFERRLPAMLDRLAR